MANTKKNIVDTLLFIQAKKIHRFLFCGFILCEDDNGLTFTWLFVIIVGTYGTNLQNYLSM